MSSINKTRMQTAFTVSIEAKKNTTGIWRSIDFYRNLKSYKEPKESLRKSIEIYRKSKGFLKDIYEIL